MTSLISGNIWKIVVLEERKGFAVIETENFHSC